MALSTTRAAATRRTRIWVADSRPADYECLTAAGCAEGLEVRFLTSARDVLRRWSAALPDVCIVNACLPCMSGFDLVEMLRPFPLGVTVGLVGDRYAAEDEVRALSLGVLYLCKPLEAAVLSGLCPRCRPERRCRR